MECPPANLQQSTKQEMDFWLSKFILEVRKAIGDEYPPNSLYSICCGMMRYIREVKPEVNFFISPVFTGLKRTLDGEMKRLRALGQGVKRKRAEPITTINEEDAMWEKGLLGCSSPQSLLDTLVYLIGISFCSSNWTGA